MAPIGSNGLHLLSALISKVHTKRHESERNLRSRSSKSSEKRALAIGMNYPGTHASLRGCINDVKNVTDLLGLKGFKDIRKMTDDQNPSSPYYPTKVNIIRELTTLISETKPGDFSVLSYSGHGSYQGSGGAEEPSGRDQVLVPVDSITDPSKLIVDDELYTIVSKLAKGATLFILSDCCFSGSNFDLPYFADCAMLDSETCKIRVGQKRPDINGCIIELSGCNDFQTSADVGVGNKAFGAMTNAFLASYRDGISYKQLLIEVRRYLARQGYSQTPQLSFGNQTKFDATLSFL